MISIDNKIITDITDALEAQFLERYPNLCVYDSDPELPEGFPCVSVVASDNITLRSTREFGKATENHAIITITVNVYTNNAVGKKELGIAIFQVIDEILQNYNFTRLMASPMPNINRSVARFTGRYSAVVGAPITQSIDGVETLVYPVFRT